MKVLIVDDCPTTRKLLSIHLRSKGYDVLLAENGLDALEKIGKEDINLILSDINMPYMDGIEFVKTLKTDPQGADIPVIMVTSEADVEEKEKAFKAGANGYLVKPVGSDTITQNIKDILKEIFEKGDACDA